MRRPGFLFLLMILATGAHAQAPDSARVGGTRTPADTLRTEGARVVVDSASARNGTAPASPRSGRAATPVQPPPPGAITPAGQRWPVPGRAALFSAVLPGLGQVYNRSWWKVPIVYGAIGTFVGLGLYEGRQYNVFRSALIERQAWRGQGLAGVPPGDPYPNLSDGLLTLNRDNFRNSRDLFYFFAIVMYGLNVLEAYVGAHLKHFRISDDLSLRWAPYLAPRPGAPPEAGATVALHF